MVVHQPVSHILYVVEKNKVVTGGQKLSLRYFLKWNFSRFFDRPAADGLAFFLFRRTFATEKRHLGFLNLWSVWCSCQKQPFGIIGFSVRDNLALIRYEGGGKIIMTSNVCEQSNANLRHHNCLHVWLSSFMIMRTKKK